MALRNEAALPERLDRSGVIVLLVNPDSRPRLFFAVVGIVMDDTLRPHRQDNEDETSG